MSAMTEVDQGVHFIPELNSAACSLLSSYTLISILDHERWMKVSVRATTCFCAVHDYQSTVVPS